MESQSTHEFVPQRLVRRLDGAECCVSQLRRPDGLYQTREYIEAAIRAAHRIGQVWERHWMPLRAMSHHRTVEKRKRRLRQPD